MNEARGLVLAPPNLHRIERPHALKIPARRAEYSLTENVASPFQAEPRHFRVLRKDGRKRTHKHSFQFFRLRRRLTQMALPKDLRPADPLPGFSDHEIPFRIDSPRRRINSGCAISRKRWIIRASLERLLHRMEMRRDGRTRLSFSRSRSEVPDGLSFLFYTRDI